MLQESFDTGFSKPGLVGMINTGNHSNGSAFFINLNDHTHLDDSVVIVGEVTQGLENVLALSELYGQANIEITGAGDL